MTKGNRMRILLTRPEPDASRTAAALRAAGHVVHVDPLLAIEPVAFDPPDGDFAAVAATSANALRAVAANPAIAKFKPLRLFALGAHTADVAREAGFSKVEIADGNASALGALLGRRLPAGTRVLYLAGENRARDLAALAAPAQLAIETVVVYRAKAKERLAAATVETLRRGEFDAVLHFSPRSAAVFLRLAEAAGLAAALPPLRHLCLSAVAAAALAPAGLKTEIAARPTEEALLKLLGT
jgi:uroporphyrinogen-III synthase